MQGEVWCVYERWTAADTTFAKNSGQCRVKDTGRQFARRQKRSRKREDVIRKGTMHTRIATEHGVWPELARPGKHGTGQDRTKKRPGQERRALRFVPAFSRIAPSFQVDLSLPSTTKAQVGGIEGKSEREQTYGAAGMLWAAVGCY